MKHLLAAIALTIALPIFSSAQGSREAREASRIYREKADTMVFPVPFTFVFIDTVSMDRHTLYGRCFQFMASNTSNLNAGMQMNDSASGRIVIPRLQSNYKSEYRYTVTVDVREGKYRVTFSDFYRENQVASYAKIPFDTVAEMKMLYLGPGTKHQYWQAEKLHERDEAEAIFQAMRAFVHRRDDF